MVFHNVLSLFHDVLLVVYDVLLVVHDVSQCFTSVSWFKGTVPEVNKFVYYTFLCNYA